MQLELEAPALAEELSVREAIKERLDPWKGHGWMGTGVAEGKVRIFLEDLDHALIERMSKQLDDIIPDGMIVEWVDGAKELVSRQRHLPKR